MEVVNVGMPFARVVYALLVSKQSRAFTQARSPRSFLAPPCRNTARKLWIPGVPVWPFARTVTPSLSTPTIRIFRAPLMPSFRIYLESSAERWPCGEATSVCASGQKNRLLLDLTLPKHAQNNPGEARAKQYSSKLVTRKKNQACSNQECSVLAQAFTPP